MSGIVWTKHAEERNKQRGITQDWIEQTLNNPDASSQLDDGKMEYKKKFGEKTVTVISTKSKEGKYLILSSWINPPNYGTPEHKYKTYNKQLKKAGNFKKIWITILHQIGF